MKTKRFPARRQHHLVLLASLIGSVGSSAAAIDCTLRAGLTAEAGRGGLCGFSPASRAFAGSPAAQAACLTRKVQPGGLIGRDQLPDDLARRVGRPVTLTPERLAAYVAQRGADAFALGGSLSNPITADYFVIHDTSDPNCSEPGISTARCPIRGQLPPDRDDKSWPDNITFQGHPKHAPDRRANVFNNRVGGSVTEVDFATPFYTTKFEQCGDVDAKAGLFIGVENIQPRIGLPAIPAPGQAVNDRIAPEPGFTAAQYDRLALIYLAASARRGHWLIPAFHAVLDSQYVDGHDDPQNFDIAAFGAAVDRHARALGG